LSPRGPARGDWLTRFRIGRQASAVARGIAREVPDARPAGGPELRDGTWALRVRVPAGMESAAFAAGMVSEMLPCSAGDAAGVVHVALCTSYSAEDVEQLVLGFAKVAYYLAREPNVPAGSAPWADCEGRPSTTAG